MRRKISAEISPVLLNMTQALNWAAPSAPGLAIAAYVDDDTLRDGDLASCLSQAEIAKAEAFINLAERRHFIVRRCFQRLFVALVAQWPASPGVLRMEQKLDTQPVCLDFPRLHLSFSTSGRSAVAGARENNDVGIDVERERVVENVVQLARRFFSEKEADAIAGLPPEEQSHHFLLHWTAKEAGLKAMGKGIVSGLNSFCLERKSTDSTYSVIGPPEAPARWSLRYVDILPNHIIALIKKE